MKLRELLRGVTVKESRANLDTDITSITADSRMAAPGALFVAIPGFKTDGAKFIDAATGKGAAVIVGESSAASVQVDDARAALSIIAANFYGRPAGKLSLVGVTGTSGKTTTTKMIESIFDAAGGPVGLVGTIEYRAGDERLMADRTTPDAVVLQQWFAKMVDAGVRNAVMEVSSHALALKRTYGIHFAAAVFTNLSQDHFDFHKDFEDYFAAKRILFDQIDRSRKTAIVNSDDEYGRRLANELGDCVVTFGRGANADIHPLDGFEISVRGLHGRVATPAGEVHVESKLLGAPNLYNWLGAIGAAQSVGIDIPTIEAGIRDLAAVRGRFEYVEAEGGPTVIVDYAHKPDALDKLLQAVRDLASGRRVVLIVGCGGDRDKDKRPKMGAIAARLADYTVLTSDNPRGEKPEAILDDIETGMRGATNYARVTDRGEAISGTIANASDDDVIVIAGKGHEPYQVIGDQVIHFDDREEAERALKTRHENRAQN
ncbi:MAG TPA: UDP-N-acetylmuramoyl-L-alanyl-D-glutamate--2,6-diaminopimelate ligase [Thermoanaerobaculia bacterium]|jgi:UDP-N-acetylmuramoyl-L-alanyl-D-glutamate--2,6-diaminopimelate ligase|nr:UDP-N-acetylmuramoyl-L-alanyl-D-glutamate--2,6-diaminopimelate ligase [Thermoanaerobaculia bacterium]